MSSPIWLLSKKEYYTKNLVENLVNNNCHVQLLHQIEFKEKFQKYLLQTYHDQECSLTLILDIELTSVINVFIQLLNSKKDSNFSTLKVIVLSNFLSWGGKSYSSPIENFEQEFNNRKCLSNSYEIYSLENYMMGLKYKLNLNLQIVATGLFYGGKGYDLYDIFNYIWRYDNTPDTENNGLNLFFHSKNKVPITYFKTFAESILNLVRSNTSDVEIESRSNFLAIIDPLNVSSLLELFNIMDQKINALSDIRLRAETLDCFARSLCENPSLAVWSCDISSNQIIVDNENMSSISLVYDDSEVIWSEFLSCNSYTPISILLTGAPNLGKTEIAKHIAERLSIQYIDLENVVKFLLNLEINNILPANISVILTATKKELSVLVEAKANEGKKSVKGAAIVNSEDFIVDEAILTLSFCQTLPNEFLRKCIAAYTSLHRICQRRGYILDVWDGNTGTIVDLESLRMALNLNISNDSVLPLSLKTIEILIELQCPLNAPMEKLMLSLGPQASKNKESQAIIKLFEATLNNYNSNFVSLDLITEEEVRAAGHLFVGHKGVKDIEKEFFNKLSILRIDTVTNNTVDSIIDIIIKSIYKIRNNKIGWLPDIKSDTDVSSAQQVNIHNHLTNNNNNSDNSMVVPQQPNSIGSINHTLVQETLSEKLLQIDSSKIEFLVTKAEKLQNFLSKTILPEVTKGMIQIEREKPDDPIKYLAEQLYLQSKNKNDSALEIAKTRFLNMLQ